MHNLHIDYILGVCKPHSTVCESDIGYILKLELQILQCLHWDINVPYPLTFLRLFSQHSPLTTRRSHVLAKYLIELCLHDLKLACLPPSQLAAVCLFISLTLLEPARFQWNQQLQSATGYTQEQLSPHIAAACKQITFVHATSAAPVSCFVKSLFLKNFDFFSIFGQ